MRHVLALSLAALATAAFGVGFVWRSFPLGVPGEFVAPRLGRWDLPITPWISLLPAAFAAVALVASVVWAMSWIETASRRSFLLMLAWVMLVGGAVQVFLEIASPMGLTKWATLYHGSYTAARLEFADVGSVLNDHAKVASSFEPNHVSANPVGWILVDRALLSFFEGHARAARAVCRIEPDEVAWSLRVPGASHGIPLADQATVTAVAYLSRCAALLVGLPLAWLVRQRYSRAAALAAAAMSMLIPAAPIAAPVADSVYPAFSTLIVALSYYASERRSWLAAGAAGACIAVGMLFSLSFLVVAALCALLVAIRAIQGHRPNLAAVIAAPTAWLGVLVLVVALSGHRAWESWQVNLAKNHEFNEFSGCTYWKWVPVNLVEFAVGMGLPASIFLAVRIAEGLHRLRSWRSADALCTAWAISLGLLILAGTNRGEVSRLWLFLMPLGAALAVETFAFDAATKRIRAVVAGALVLQTVNAALLSRELLLYGFWHSVPHEVALSLNDETPRQWSSLRRLTDEEYQRRTGKLPADLHPGAKAEAIRPSQTAYLWSAQEDMVGVAADPGSYAAFVRAAEAHDTATLDELTASKRIGLLPHNTRVAIVKVGEQTHLVRIIEDGTTAYVGARDVHPEKKR
jgi:hypothetical protein